MVWINSIETELIIYPIRKPLQDPFPQIHSVAEHVSHILAWRKECLLRFKGSRTDLMNSPEDWKNNIELKKTG
jgi:hypothetical protein